MPVFSLQSFSFGTSANPFDGRRRSVRTPGAQALLEAPDSVNTPRLPTLWEEPQLLPFDRQGSSTIRDKKYLTPSKSAQSQTSLCKMAHRCTREGEKTIRECVWLRTDLNTTSPFQRAHRWMPHKSLRQEHGPGDECIVGCQKVLKAAARLIPASAKSHTNLNGRNTAHSNKFHSSLTGALRLKPARSSPDATRDSSVHSVESSMRATQNSKAKSSDEGQNRGEHISAHERRCARVDSFFKHFHGLFSCLSQGLGMPRNGSFGSPVIFTFLGSVEMLSLVGSASKWWPLLPCPREHLRHKIAFAGTADTASYSDCWPQNHPHTI